MEPVLNPVHVPPIPLTLGKYLTILQSLRETEPQIKLK